VETLGKKYGGHISVANYKYFGLNFAFTHISQGTEYELFASHRYMPEIHLLFTCVIHFCKFQAFSQFPPPPIFFVKRKID
jgi:hypothetical protein